MEEKGSANRMGLVVAIVLIIYIMYSLYYMGGLYMPHTMAGKSNFMAYTINGTNPFSNGIITNGGTFTNTSMLF